MGSLNPVFVTRSAMADRADQLMGEFTSSFTMSAGQFCTKPGLLFVPAGMMRDQEIAGIVAAHGTAAPLLDQHIEEGYTTGLTTLRDHPAMRTIVAGDPISGDAPGPTLLGTNVAALLAARDALLVECFGPTSLLVDYADDDELLAAAQAFGGQLAAGVHGGATDAIVPALLAILTDRAGRVLWNGWPTGVSVTEAMQHGGPYPATTSPLHTSVGTASIDRFLRPVCYQSMPDPLLPPALRDDNPLGLPRRVNGHCEMV
jgi:NADP-dependent aldehyde dehydrogenase